MKYKIKLLLTGGIEGVQLLRGRVPTPDQAAGCSSLTGVTSLCP